MKSKELLEETAANSAMIQPITALDMNTNRRESKTRSESALRRDSRRQGFIMKKARTRNPENPEHGTYCLVCAYTNFLELGDHNTGFGYSLEEIDEYLRQPV